MLWKRIIMKRVTHFNIKIPAGIDTGTRLRVQGRGNQSKSGERGDLYLIFNVEDDELFVRDGIDILYRGSSIPSPKQPLEETIQNSIT